MKKVVILCTILMFFLCKMEKSGVKWQLTSKESILEAERRQRGEMFTGSYFNTIDAKGRVFIPTKLRYSLGESIRLAKGFDDCLYIFTLDSWNDFTEKYVKNRSLKDPKARKLERFFLGGSHELVIDRQGRINLPGDFIEYIGIKKDVVFVGCGDRVELWSAEGFKKEMDPEAIDPSELMREAAEAPAEE